MLLERIYNGNESTTHASEYDYTINAFRSLEIQSDVFCSVGTLLPGPGGRLLSIGGWANASLEAIRIFTPCGSPGVFGTCEWQENDSVAALLVSLYLWLPYSV